MASVFFSLVTGPEARSHQLLLFEPARQPCDDQVQRMHERSLRQSGPLFAPRSSIREFQTQAIESLLQLQDLLASSNVPNNSGFWNDVTSSESTASLPSVAISMISASVGLKPTDDRTVVKSPFTSASS